MMGEHGLEHFEGQGAELLGNVSRDDSRVLHEIPPLPTEAVVVDVDAPGCVAHAGVHALLALSGSTITNRLRSPSCRPVKDVTVSSCPASSLGRTRWPRVRKPLSTMTSPFFPAMRPCITKGTTCPSRRTTIQRIGRPNGKAPLPSSSQASQLIRFGKASPRSVEARTPGRMSAAGAPPVFRTKRRWVSSGFFRVLLGSLEGIDVHAVLASKALGGAGPLPRGVPCHLERGPPDALLALRLAGRHVGPED